MTRIYWRWCADVKYEFYIGTGRTRKTPDLKTEVEEMVVIYLVGKRVCTNKRRRLKKYLQSSGKFSDRSRRDLVLVK